MTTTRVVIMQSERMMVHSKVPGLEGFRLNILRGSWGLSKWVLIGVISSLSGVILIFAYL